MSAKALTSSSPDKSIPQSGKNLMAPSAVTSFFAFWGPDGFDDLRIFSYQFSGGDGNLPSWLLATSTKAYPAAATAAAIEAPAAATVKVIPLTVVGSMTAVVSQTLIGIFRVSA